MKSKDPPDLRIRRNAGRKSIGTRVDSLDVAVREQRLRSILEEEGVVRKWRKENKGHKGNVQRYWRLKRSKQSSMIDSRSTDLNLNRSDDGAEEGLVQA